MSVKVYHTIKEIPDIEFTGYYWMSDADKPVLVNGKFSPPLAEVNPFVKEAGLLAKDGTCSISVDNTGETCFIRKVSWKEVEKEKVSLQLKTYLSHGLEKVKYIFLIQAWIPEPDPLCEGMEVLKPSWQVFAGFDKITEYLQKIINAKTTEK